MGDVYVLAAGLPIRIGDRHIEEIANCALDVMSGTYTQQIVIMGRDSRTALEKGNKIAITKTSIIELRIGG